MKKTKKFKENHPENYHVHDRGIEDLDLFLPGDVGGREERWVNFFFLFGMWVSSLYIVSTLSICIYLPYFSRYFLPIFQVT